MTTDCDLEAIEIASPDNDNDIRCGLLCLRPSWLQRFATKRAFLFFFCATSVLQGMYFTYIVSVLTTLEKLYQMPSKTMGLILAASEIGQIGGSLLLAHFGGRGDRPKWIGTGVLVFAAASLLCSTPHLLLPNGIISTTNLNTDQVIVNEVSTAWNSRVNSQNHSIALAFNQHLCVQGLKSDLRDQFTSDSCKAKIESNQDSHSSAYWATWILSMASLLVGVGTTAVNTLGIPYIDDNVAPKESPLYFAITIGLRIFGPVFGFLLGSVCTSIYIHFPFDSGIGLTPAHPQWIGAWWLGVFIIGWLLFFISFVVMSFPKRLPHPDQDSFNHNKQRLKQLSTNQVVISEQEPLPGQCCTISDENGKKVLTLNNNELDEKQLLMDSLILKTAVPLKEEKLVTKKSHLQKNSFQATLGRLLRNRILICRIASTILHILPISGLYTFLPKYLENQFQLTASDASFISGLAGILIMGIGIFTSGIIMRKLNPSPRLVTRWIASATFLYAFGMLALTLLGCDPPSIANHSISSNFDRTLNQDTFLLGCSDCHCPEGQFMPLCSSKGLTYLSPCTAGCTGRNMSKSEFTYTDCGCLASDERIIKNGICDRKCPNLFWYVLVFSLLALVHSTTEVGAMLVTLRCVQPEDKAVALGLVTFGGSLLGSFPCPIIYGTLVDSTCLHWQQECGAPGACRMFDSWKFRFYFHGLTAFLMGLAFLVDFSICLMASRIQFLEDGSSILKTDDSNKIHNKLDSIIQKKRMNGLLSNDDNNNDDDKPSDQLFSAHHESKL